MQVARKDVERASRLIYLALTALALLKVVEVMRAMGVDILCQRVLIDFYRLICRF